MLFLALTHSKIAALPEGFETLKLGEWFLSCGTEGGFSDLKMTDQTLNLSEVCNYHLPNSSKLAEIAVDLNRLIGVIHCPTLGGRPLYHHIDRQGQFFCSTQIGMLRKAGVEIRENQSVVPEFFSYRCVMPPNTLFESIFQIELGASLHVTFGGPKISLEEKTYRPPARNSKLELDDAAKKMTSRLAHVTKINTTNNSNILLSGGIDSSIVFQLAQKETGVSKSYASSYPFEKPEHDVERKYALSSERLFDTTHSQYEPTTKRYRQAVIESIAAAEIPIHHLQSPIMYLFCKDRFAGSNEPVVNSIGAGGAFGNYRNFLYQKRRPAFRMASNPLGQQILKGIYKLTGRGKYLLESIRTAERAKVPPSSGDSIWEWHAYGDADWIKKRLKGNWETIVQGPSSSMKKYFDLPLEDVWALYSLLGDETATINVWSKLAEACNQTMLFPMYDKQVLDMALSLSWSEKLAPPENRLRRTIATLAGVPEEVIARPKSGFGVQRPDWALPGGPFDALVPIAAKVVEESWLNELRVPDPKSAMTFWNLLNFAIWKRLVINGEPVQELLEELAFNER